MRHAPEYYLLAKIILKRAQSLNSPDEGVGGLGKALLDKYDETDMSKVSALIAEFQNMNLEAM